jgi:hypothetical protein
MYVPLTCEFLRCFGDLPEFDSDVLLAQVTREATRVVTDIT